MLPRMMKRLGTADYRDMPWKNGGGVTRELLKLPHPSVPDRFLARLSIATVTAPGPFSVFPGIDRILTLLEGPGMALSFGSTPEVVLDRRWQPFARSGPVVPNGTAPSHSSRISSTRPVSQSTRRKEPTSTRSRSMQRGSGCSRSMTTR